MTRHEYIRIEIARLRARQKYAWGIPSDSAMQKLAGLLGAEIKALEEMDVPGDRKQG